MGTWHSSIICAEKEYKSAELPQASHPTKQSLTYLIKNKQTTALGSLSATCRSTDICMQQTAWGVFFFFSLPNLTSLWLSSVSSAASLIQQEVLFWASPRQETILCWRGPIMCGERLTVFFIFVSERLLTLLLTNTRVIPLSALSHLPKPKPISACSLLYWMELRANSTEVLNHTTHCLCNLSLPGGCSAGVALMMPLIRGWRQLEQVTVAQGAQWPVIVYLFLLYLREPSMSY